MKVVSAEWRSFRYGTYAATLVFSYSETGEALQGNSKYVFIITADNFKDAGKRKLTYSFRRFE